MAAVGQEQSLHVARAALDGFDLLQGPVLVLLSLYGQDGRVDARQEFLQVPFQELRIKPGAVPAPEGRVHVLGVLREPRPQIARLVSFARLRDAAQAPLLGEYVRGLADQRARLPAATRVADSRLRA